jgi:putative ABC transport system permease protein
VRSSPLRFLSAMSRRDFKSHWAQFLAIIGIGGVAVTLFVGLLANAESVENRVNQAYDEGNMADLWVTTSSYDKDDLSHLKDLTLDNGDAEGRFFMAGRIGNSTVTSSVTQKLPTISKPYAMENDEWPEENFVLVDTALAHDTDAARAARFQVGNTISVAYDISSYIDSKTASLLDSVVLKGGHNIFLDSSLTLDFKITGIMSYPENVCKASYNSSTFLVDDETFRKSVYQLLSKNFNAFGLGIIYNALYQSPLAWGSGVLDLSKPLTTPNQYLVTLNDNSQSQAVEDSIRSYFSSKDSDNLASVTNRSNMAFVTTMHNDVVQARQFTFLFPFVFFFVAVLVILTTISQIILKERLQIGTMKALGLSSHEIYFHYISLAMSVVAIGTLLGEIIGPILIPFILGQKYDILYSLPSRSYVFPVLYGVLTAVVFLGVTALVTYLVCRKEVRLKPAESMRPEVPHIKAVESKILASKKSVRFLSLKMAFRNIRMDKVKSIMVVTGVLGCTALLCCGYGIEDTVNYGISHDMELGNSAPITVAFSSPQSRATIEKDMSVDGVDSYEPFTRAMSTISLGDTSSNSYVYFLGNDENSHLKVDFANDKVALSEKVSRETGAKVGDTISFTYSTYSFEAEIDVIYEAFIYNGVMVHSSSPILSSTQAGESFQGAYLELKEGYEPSEVKSRLQGISYVISVTTQQDWHNQINDIMSGVLIMTNAVKIFAIILAVVVLYNLALLNFRERTRDIATLKVLGFTRREIAFSLLWETMTLTLVGVLIGLALGYPFMLAVMKLNIVELVEYLYTITWQSYLYSFLLTFVVAFAVNAWLSYRTGQVKMVESLKSVE